MIKHLAICFLFTSLAWAGNPQALIGQKNISDVGHHHSYQRVDGSNIAYVYGPDGDQIVYVNFNFRGALISKTTYRYSDKKKNFIYNDDCKKRECQQFIH